MNRLCGGEPMKRCLLKVIVYRDESIPDQWVGHCLDLDIVVQGTDVSQTLEALKEAVGMVVEDDLDHNIDPLERPSAPQEYWEKFFDVVTAGEKVTPSEFASATLRELVMMMEVVRPLHPILDEDHPSNLQIVPDAWQIAAFEKLRSSDPCIRN